MYGILVSELKLYYGSGYSQKFRLRAVQQVRRLKRITPRVGRRDAARYGASVLL
jgi:hypothetical protein